MRRKKNKRKRLRKSLLRSKRKRRETASPMSSLTLALVAPRLADLSLLWANTHQKLQRTSGLFVLEKWVRLPLVSLWPTKAAFSIVSFQVLWPKVVTILTEQDMEDIQSMEKPSMMRPLSISTRDVASCPWQTPERTPMDLSSSWPLLTLPTSTASMSSLARLLVA